MMVRMNEDLNFDNKRACEDFEFSPRGFAPKFE
jgi:hypothetical protein